MTLQIDSIKLKDRAFDNWFTEVLDRWNYMDLKNDPNWRRDWISFDCLCYVNELDIVYAGITSLENDIFRGYNHSSKEWVSTGYERIADPYDAKFHRSLIYHDNCLYGAIALLHDIENYWDAPGGAIVRYNPYTSDIEKIGIPIPHAYIQSIVLDEKRGIIYGQTFTPERLFSFDIETRQTKDLGPIGSAMEMAQGQNLVLDDDGKVWGSWGVSRAWQDKPGVDSFRLFRYSPGAERIDFLKTGLPNPDGSYGNVKLDAFFNFGTGCLYASGTNGAMYQVDTSNGLAEYLFDPQPKTPSRLSAMTLAPDGIAYGVVGKEGNCQLMIFNPSNEKHELLGPIKDKDSKQCWQIHDIVALPDGSLYAAENDVPHRSSYLWHIRK